MANEDTVAPGGEFQPFDEEFGNITAEHYETRGQTTVATRPGYRFVPSDASVPVITSKGVKVTATQAEELVEASAKTSAKVHIVDDEKED